MIHSASVTSETPLEEEELLRRYHLEGDTGARRLLIEQMMPLVRTLARRYVNRGESLEDL